MKDFNQLKDAFLSTLGKAAETGKTVATKAVEVGNDVATKAADKAKAGTRIAKLSVEISTEKENMKKTYTEIGKLYYDTHKDAPEGFFIQLCEEITMAKEAIAAKEAEMAELKGTGAEADVTVDFEEVVEEAEAAAAETVEEVVETVEEAVEEVVEIVEEAPVVEEEKPEE